ncbi:hypothetical protein BDZ89DRAFT_1104856 [Hymenopellis radicata]|nr:hypothetical protein BDZ89DRAFT_1104856 [Hymenopellis radicata]
METITLFQLCLYPQEPMSFAPHVWKTLLPLRLLNVPFKTELVTLTQLREELPKRLGLASVTVPIIVIRAQDESERTIMDSYEIAQYLEKTYSSPLKSIYAPAGNGTPEDAIAGRAHARFIEQWVDKCMAHELRPCVLHTSYAQFPESGDRADLKSRAHFLAKCGRAKLDELTAQNADRMWLKEQYARARKQLGLINLLLEERHQRGEPGDFLAGTKPTHADFCVFAFYPYSLTNPSLVRNTWRHPDLPYVSRWLEAMFESGLVSKEELLPEDIDSVETLD